MKPLNTHRWNLSCIEGWEMTNLKLTHLFNDEIEKINNTNNDDPSQVWDIAKLLWQTMISHFKQAELTPFGTSDSDVEMALREAINKSLGVWPNEHITCQL